MSDTNELTTTVSPEQSSDDSAVDDGVVVLTNGVRVLNTSPNPFVFTDGTLVPPCGTTLDTVLVDMWPVKDAPTYLVNKMTVLEFIRTEKRSTPEGRNFISAVVERYGPDGVLILGSAITMEAYGYPVVMAIDVNRYVPTAETEGRGTPPAEKRMRIDRFTLGPRTVWARKEGKCENCDVSTYDPY